MLTDRLAPPSGIGPQILPVPITRRQHWLSHPLLNEPTALLNLACNITKLPIFHYKSYGFSLIFPLALEGFQCRVGPERSSFPSQLVITYNPTFTSQLNSFRYFALAKHTHRKVLTKRIFLI